jgi:ADP-heptose:LPS heptosyltransferase
LADSEALLIRIGGLGDLVVSLPSIALVRRLRPGAALTLACRPEYGALLKMGGLVDEVVDAGSRRYAFLFGDPRAATPEEDDWLRRFGLVIAWRQKAGPFPLEAWGGPGTGRVVVIAFPERIDKPASRAFFDETHRALAEPGTPAPAFEDCARLELPPKAREDGRRYFGFTETGAASPPAVIHPGSGGAGKRWPLDRFLAIAGRLAARGTPGVIVTGESEERLGEALRGAALPAGWRSFSSPPLGALAGLLAGAAVYLGNDSGITHLAAACGAPTVALFRRDLEPLWRPFGPATVLAADAPASISLEAVWSALLARLQHPASS